MIVLTLEGLLDLPYSNKEQKREKLSDQDWSFCGIPSIPHSTLFGQTDGNDLGILIKLN